MARLARSATTATSTCPPNSSGALATPRSRLMSSAWPSSRCRARDRRGKSRTQQNPQDREFTIEVAAQPEAITGDHIFDAFFAGFSSPNPFGLLQAHDYGAQDSTLGPW